MLGVSPKFRGAGLIVRPISLLVFSLTILPCRRGGGSIRSVTGDRSEIGDSKPKQARITVLWLIAGAELSFEIGWERLAVLGLQKLTCFRASLRGRDFLVRVRGLGGLSYGENWRKANLETSHTN